MKSCPKAVLSKTIWSTCIYSWPAILGPATLLFRGVNAKYQGRKLRYFYNRIRVLRLTAPHYEPLRTWLSTLCFQTQPPGTGGTTSNPNTSHTKPGTPCRTAADVFFYSFANGNVISTLKCRLQFQHADHISEPSLMLKQPVQCFTVERCLEQNVRIPFCQAIRVLGVKPPERRYQVGVVFFKQHPTYAMCTYAST